MAYESTTQAASPPAQPVGHFALLSDIRDFAVLNGFTTDRYDDTGTGDTRVIEWIAHGAGDANNDVYIGIEARQLASSNHFYFTVRSFTGFSSGLSWDTQPGATGEKFVNLVDTAMDYWLVVNDRRLAFVAQSGTTWQGAYLGWILPVATPAEYPSPMVVWGTGSAAAPISTVSNRDLFGCVQHGNGTAGYILLPDGIEQAIHTSIASVPNVGVWPRAAGALSQPAMLDRGENTTDYAELDLQLYRSSGVVSAPPSYLLGVLDGIKWISGFAQTALDDYTIATVRRTIFPSLQEGRGGTVTDYIALVEA